MNTRVTKLKARRVFRRRRKQVDEFADNATRTIDKHVFKQINSIGEVLRFIVAWTLLIGLLIGGLVYQTRGLASQYLSVQPTSGGVFSEGVVGTYSTPNPLFADTSVDLSVVKLLFNSLLTYDHNGQIVNDLAESVEVDDSGKIYTVVLRDNVYWHDGEKLDSGDVVYTYKTIQNPASRSTYNLSWQGIGIDAPNERTVRFTLPTPLNSFRLSLTNGIVPQHILSRIPVGELRGDEFNLVPVGTGPFRLKAVDRVDDFETNSKRQRLEFVRNDDYFKGSPKDYFK